MTSDAAASAEAWSRSTIATLAPNSARPSAKRRPRMPHPPVMTAVRPVRSNRALKLVVIAWASSGRHSLAQQQFNQRKIEIGIDVDRAFFRHLEQTRVRIEDRGPLQE